MHKENAYMVGGSGVGGYIGYIRAGLLVVENTMHACASI